LPLADYFFAEGRQLWLNTRQTKDEQMAELIVALDVASTAEVEQTVGRWETRSLFTRSGWNSSARRGRMSCAR
jgi:hypothetical protein